MNDLLKGVTAGSPWSTLGHGARWAHCQGSSSSLGWGWQAWHCHLPGCPESGISSFLQFLGTA